MRTSKKRKLAGLKTKPINVVVLESVYVKLNRIAGQASLVETIETLVDREYRRRERKMLSLQVVDSPLKTM